MAGKMRIWKRDIDIDRLNQRGINTMASALGIEFGELGDDYLTASMPVDERTKQPLGLLNGGASAALAETAASTAANFCVGEGYYCLGTQVIANHLRPVQGGAVTATCRPIHLGRTTQLWEVSIHDARARLICSARMSMVVMKAQ